MGLLLSWAFGCGSVQKDSHERKKIATRRARPASSQFGWRNALVAEILQTAIDRRRLTDAAEVRRYRGTINCKFKPGKRENARQPCE